MYSRFFSASFNVPVVVDSVLSSPPVVTCNTCTSSVRQLVSFRSCLAWHMCKPKPGHGPRAQLQPPEPAGNPDRCNHPDDIKNGSKKMCERLKRKICRTSDKVCVDGSSFTLQTTTDTVQPAPTATIKPLPGDALLNVAQKGAKRKRQADVAVRNKIRNKRGEDSAKTGRRCNTQQKG